MGGRSLVFFKVGRWGFKNNNSRNYFFGGVGWGGGIKGVGIYIW
jgi:hypothetical protein